MGTTERIQAILAAIIDESVVEKPLNYDLSHISSTLRCAMPKKSQIVAGFRSLDYMISQSFYDPKLWKTNAPPDVIYDVFKAWVRQMWVLIKRCVEKEMV